LLLFYPLSSIAEDDTTQQNKENKTKQKTSSQKHIILEAPWKHLRSTILRTMDSLLPPEWGKANYRDKDSGKQVEYYYNRKTHQTSWAPCPPANFSSFLVQLPPPISTVEGSGVPHKERDSFGLGMTALELTFDLTQCYDET
jgi:hypothetical protein